MKSSMALAASLMSALTALLLFAPTAVSAATIEADIVPGALNLTDDAFSPNPIQANVGDTVIWTNRDTTIHDVTAGTPSEGPSGEFGGTEGQPILIFAGGTFEHTFENEGEFPYYCTLHPNMVGTVVVSANGVDNGDPVNGEPVQSTATASHDGITYTVTAMSAETSVTSAEIIPAEAVRVQFTGAGEVELTMPKDMIDGIEVVTSNGDTVGFVIVSEDAESTTISFSVPDAAEVEIMAAMVVPEFGVIAALVLAVSLVSVIGFARFRGSSFGLGRL